MSKSNAEMHALIAKEVHPGADIKIAHPSPMRAHSEIYICAVSGKTFNLLATNPDGTPTTQAKADALDVLRWISVSNVETDQETAIIYELNCCHPGLSQEAIFAAASSIIKEGKG